MVDAVVPKVLGWFRDFHQNPELGLEEVRTSGIVAAHLRSLGLEVRTGVGKTGVVGLVKGPRPGPVVALRADMDALPVTEKTGLPYASKPRGPSTGVRKWGSCTPADTTPTRRSSWGPPRS